MRPGVAAIVACAALTAAGCGGGGDSGGPAVTAKSDVELRQVALADASDASAVVTASDAFGLDVLAGSDPTANLVFSPASAFVALGMLGEGATNAGAAEFDGLLGSAGEARSEAINALAGVLAAFEGDPASVVDEDLPEDPVLHMANNVVLDDRAQAATTYLDRLAEYYDAGVMVTDLATAQGIEVLDAWVRANTGGRIEQSAIEPNELLYLVLQDAVLFAARWLHEFDPNQTAEATFTAASGATQTADLMNGQWDLRYAQVDGWTAVELPYRGTFAARLVLPPVGTDPASIGAGAMERLDAALNAAAPTSVAVALPRFDTDATIDLSEALRARGLTAIFDAQSRSFEGIDPDEALFVGQAVQQATITVGEQGTVAAAVTEIGLSATGIGPEPEHRFVADRPFLMVVQETTTGWDLFQSVVRSIG